MSIKAEFVKSAVTLEQCPLADRPEYAFIGRSNVGKSSLINMLVNHKGLAKTSSSPGKTQTINYFNIEDAYYMVDLPGYGYAKVSQAQRKQWSAMIWNYLSERTSLMCVFILIDCRVPPQKSDIDFINQLGEAEIPCIVIFTKSDKLGKTTLVASVSSFKKSLSLYWDELPLMIISSAEKKLGREDVMQLIETSNKNFVKDVDASNLSNSKKNI
ncbi:MAG: YihA family ribosome biogenesis GTP-binding protein [Bacteroidetes bacterium]|nr:YihA family ribosome biogenesis GTP-binding protein [Bacteroidota bacterium]